MKKLLTTGGLPEIMQATSPSMEKTLSRQNELEAYNAELQKNLDKGMEECDIILEL